MKITKTKLNGKFNIEYSVWEKCDNMSEAGNTISFFNGELYTRVGTDPDKSKFEHLKPGSDERIKAVREEYKKRYKVAYDAILNEFGNEIVDYEFDMGHIKGMTTT